MAESELSQAKVVLLAVQLAAKADVLPLRSLLSAHRKTLRHDLLLRILLSHLPESLSPSEYVPLLQELLSGSTTSSSNYPIDASALDSLSEASAKKAIRKLHLLPLSWPGASPDTSADPFVQFLMHRAIRIDQVTGLIGELPALLVPFIHLSDSLRMWFISTILPLERFGYEYYPEKNTGITIPKFEALDVRTGVALLLSGAEEDKSTNAENQTNIGRDLKRLVGPWMYGDTPSKRRKLQRESSLELQSVQSLDERQFNDEKHSGWEEVFKWLVDQAESSGKIAVEAVEQWDGPGDLDLGGYADSTSWLDEDAKSHLESRYARTALAMAYTIPTKSKEALEGVQRILSRIISLLDKDRIPTLQAASAILSPVTGLDDILKPKTNIHLRKNLLQEDNLVTTPNDESIKFLHALLVSASLFAKSDCHISLKEAGELVLLQDIEDQTAKFETLMMRTSATAPKGDDKFWIKKRNEILWLRTWGAEELSDHAVEEHGKGVFGHLSKEYIEGHFLKCLLQNQRYAVVRTIYEPSSGSPLSELAQEQTLTNAAMHAYDNATNPNKTRGGLQECLRILNSCPDILDKSAHLKQLVRLVDLTHNVGTYRLVLKQGEPFKPVNLRVHSDPISIIGKILEQNPGSYTKIADFVNMGHDMVKAGLTTPKDSDQKILEGMALASKLITAERRIVSICIDAALIEDDFETAYSFVSTRLKNIAGLAQTHQMQHQDTGFEGVEPAISGNLPPDVEDDWSWRAALQAGKYRRTSKTVKPTHFGNASGNPDVRHLEQRMECFSHALRVAPKGTLVEILNQWRRCEEELESLYKLEAEQEDAWDEQGDDQSMPGGFGATPVKRNMITSTSRPAEEAPLSLFDLSRASVARAQSGLATLSLLRGNSTQQSHVEPRGSNEIPRLSTPDSAGSKAPMRKRDQLKNVAVGGLASGVGWLIGAPGPAAQNVEPSDEP